MQNSLTETDASMETGGTSPAGKYLTFWTDSELYGIPISDVVQIISMQGITPLPDFPAYAKGVINLRGNIIPVIDIRIRFRKPETEYSDSTCIIVTSIEDAYMGFIVDSVDEVTDLDEDGISPSPKVSKDITNRYLTGIGQIGEKVVLLLDVAKILSENELEDVHETAARGGTEPGNGGNPQEADPGAASRRPEPVELSPVAAQKDGKGEL